MPPATDNPETVQNASALAHVRRILATGTPIRRTQLLVTLLLTLAGVFAELVTIGAVLPVLAIAAAPSRAAHLPVVGSFLPQLGASLGVTPILAAAFLLVVAALGATAVRLLLSWTSQKFVYGLQQDLVLYIYGRTLRQPYGWFITQNSSVLIAGLQKVNSVVFGMLSPLLLAATSAIMALCIVLFLFLIDPATALFASVSIGVVYVLISVLSRRAIRSVSEGIAQVGPAVVQAMQESLGGIRDILLDQSQPIFEAKLRRLEDSRRRLFIASAFSSAAPRLIVEGAAIVLVAIMAAWFSLRPGGVLAAVPVLGALALGAQRLLPMVQSIYLGYNGYALNAASLRDVVALIDTPIEGADERPAGAGVVPFKRRVELERLTFAYASGRVALEAVDLTIMKGDRIGLIGKTGSGKSTLVDVIMGLLRPTAGSLRIDGEAIGPGTLGNWKAQIAHVPQAIFLADASIAANIAFGHAEDQVDAGRLVEAADKAGLTEFVTALPDGLATEVGERGVRLSGGQRQRIGIARALYKQASVLILDEATSALDDETETAVMNSVDKLDSDLTIIIIAHRLSTIARCNQVYRLEGGRIVQQGSYAEVVRGMPVGAE